jgi:PAS domain S-box-containing protein
MMSPYPKPEAFASFPLELEAIYATAPIGLCVLDTQLRYVRINHRLAEINGLTVEQHLGRSVRDILPQLADAIEPQLQAVLDTGEARLDVEVVSETPAQPGVIRTWREQWLPLRNAQGAVIGINIVAEEVTRDILVEGQSRLLQQFGFELAAAATTAQVVAVIMRTALQFTSGGYSSVFRLADDEQALERLEAVGLAAHYQQKYARLPLNDPFPITDAVRNRQMLVIPTQEDYMQRYPHVAGDIQALGTHSVICLPFYGANGVTGGMSISFTQTKQLMQQEVNLLLLMAQTCGQAVERARLYEAAQQAADQIERLQSVTAALALTITPDDVARVAVEQTSNVLDAKSAHFSVYDPKEQSFERLYTSAELSPEDLAKWRFYPALPGYPATYVVESKQPLWLSSNAEQRAQFPILGEYATQIPGAAAGIPLFSNQDVRAVLWLSFAEDRAFSEDECALVLAIAQQCAQAFERAHLAEQAKQTATLEERQRLARDLHDAVSQNLTAATILAETAPRLWERDPQKALDVITQVFQLTKAAQAELRILLWELRPEAILNTKPVDLLKQLIQVIDGRKGMSAELIAEGEDGMWPEPVQVAFYRIAQESLNNVLKHSDAKKVTIQLNRTSQTFTLRITDDGRGFNTTQTSGGLGMGTMRERAALIGAKLDILSQPDQGTEVILVAPINSSQ